VLPQDIQAAGTPFPAQPSDPGSPQAFQGQRLPPRCLMAGGARPEGLAAGMPAADRDLMNSPSFSNQQLFDQNYQSPRS
jgi:hypothetical protein